MYRLNYDINYNEVHWTKIFSKNIEGTIQIGNKFYRLGTITKNNYTIAKLITFFPKTMRLQIENNYIATIKSKEYLYLDQTLCKLLDAKKLIII